MLTLVPVTFAEARAFVAAHHRHHLPPIGHKFSIGAADVSSGGLVGVITVGRPVARALDDGWTLEVTRCCVLEGVKNGCSLLYGAAWRAGKALGYRRLITYTLASEGGTSLRAAGWTALYETRERPAGWDTASRRRAVKAPTGPKTFWSAPAVGAE